MYDEVLMAQLKARRAAASLTQRQAAEQAGIRYGSYIVAETYGRMGFMIRTQVLDWLGKSLPGKRSKRKTQTTQ
jgi:hypothetical protein